MSLMDLLMSGPSAADKALQVLGMTSGGASDPRAPLSPSTGALPHGVLQPNDPRLVTRMGVTLVRPAMRSLVDIARQADVRPGIGELKMISDSYRSPEQQAAAYANKPGLAAPPGQSYHQRGLAVDAGEWSANDVLSRLLAQADWNRFSPTGEPWHWSYGVTG